MKSLTLLVKHFNRLGIFRSSHDDQVYGIIAVSAYYIVWFMILQSCLWYFAFIARSFVEFAECFYYILHSLLHVVWYTIYLLQQKHFYKHIVTIQGFIASSK